MFRCFSRVQVFILLHPHKEGCLRNSIKSSLRRLWWDISKPVFCFQLYQLQEFKQKPDLAGFKPRAAALITSATATQKAKQEKLSIFWKTLTWEWSSFFPHFEKKPTEQISWYASKVFYVWTRLTSHWIDNFPVVVFKINLAQTNEQRLML